MKISLSGITFDTKDLIRIPQSPTMLPRRFTSKLASADPSEGTLELTIEVSDSGRPHCVALVITAGDENEVTGEVLRRLRLDELTKRQTLRAATVLQAEDLPGRITQIGPATATEHAEKALKEHRRTSRTPRQGSRVADEDLAEAAKIYRKAMRTHGSKKAPTAEIAKLMFVDRSTAGRWVGLCREKGLLGPAQRGKAGG